MGKVFRALNKTRHDDETLMADNGQDIISNEPPAPEGMTDQGQITLPPHPIEFEQPPEQTEMLLQAPQTTAEEAFHDLNEKLITFTGASSVIAESFRRLRNRILHPPEGESVRSILVTSVVPEEGKSFVCANLGITLAQGIEQHALIVDGDLRRPSLANLFGVSNEKGLVNHLQDGTDISDLIHNTGLPKLSLIPSGPLPTNPAELLNSEKMATMIAEVVQRYQDRFILIDSPPINAASETSVLSKYVDGVVVVVRYGYSRREEIKHLIDDIGQEKVIGIIFNAFEKNWLDSKNPNSYQNYYDYQQTS